MIENLDEAVRFFNKEVLNNQGKITKVFYGERGVLAKRLTVNEHVNYVVFFKKSWNPYFGKKFRMPEYEIGQSCKLNILQEVANDYNEIGIVHPNTEIYMCNANRWLHWAKQHGTIWTPSTEVQSEASIPKDMLTRHMKQIVTPPPSDHIRISTEEERSNNLDGWM